jgi:chromosome segregation ATPase
METGKNDTLLEKLKKNLNDFVSLLKEELKKKDVDNLKVAYSFLSLSEYLEEFKSEVLSLKSHESLENIREELEELMKSLEESSKEEGELRKTLNELAVKKREWEEKKNTIEKLRKEINELKTLKRKIEETNISSLQAKKEELIRQVGEVEKQIIELNGQLKNEKERLEELKHKAEELKDIYEVHKKANEFMSQQFIADSKLNSLRKKVENALKEWDEKLKEIMETLNRTAN